MALQFISFQLPRSPHDPFNSFLTFPVLSCPNLSGSFIFIFIHSPFLHLFYFSLLPPILPFPATSHLEHVMQQVRHSTGHVDVDGIDEKDGVVFRHTKIDALI